MTSKLQRIVDGCKTSVHVNVNDHRSVYATVQKWLEDIGVDDEDVSPEVRAEMIRLDRTVQIFMYVNTPVGSYVIYHHDLELALDEALKVLAENGA